MSKVKERKTIVEELEVAMTKANSIHKVLALILTFTIIAIIMLILRGENTRIGIYILLAFTAVYLVFCIYWNKLDRQIKKKKKERSLIVRLQSLAHSGKIKTIMTLQFQEKNLISILSQYMEKILIEEVNDNDFITTIYFKNHCHQFPVRISQEKFLSILDESTKKEILEHFLESIQIEEKDDGTSVTITDIQGYKKESTQATTEELLQIFAIAK